MNKKIVLMVSVFLLLITGISQAKTLNPLPFAVTIGGQKAVLDGLYGRIPNAVAPDAELEADLKASMININAFPSDKTGKVTDGAEAIIYIIMGGGNKIKLSESMAKTPLKPGFYMINVSSPDGETASVITEVK